MNELPKLLLLAEVTKEYFDALDSWASPNRGGLGHQEGRLNKAERNLRRLLGRSEEPCTIGNTAQGTIGNTDQVKVPNEDLEKLLKDCSEKFHKILSNIEARKLVERDGRGREMPASVLKVMVEKYLTNEEVAKLCVAGFEECVMELIKMRANLTDVKLEGPTEIPRDIKV